MCVCVRAHQQVCLPSWHTVSVMCSSLQERLRGPQGAPPGCMHLCGPASLSVEVGSSGDPRAWVCPPVSEHGVLKCICVAQGSFSACVCAWVCVECVQCALECVCVRGPCASPSGMSLGSGGRTEPACSCCGWLPVFVLPPPWPLLPLADTLEHEIGSSGAVTWPGSLRVTMGRPMSAMRPATCGAQDAAGDRPLPVGF